MLTELEIAKLTYPFPRDDHSFLQGYVYISEEAIGERIEKVDPEWRFTIDEMSALGDSVVVRATLTIRGVSRSNIGGNPIQRDKQDKDAKGNKLDTYSALPLYTQADNGVNAYKAAATDAYKRCARLFGIGRYLLGAPKEGRQFEEWLNAQTVAAKAQLQALKAEAKSVDTETGEITRPQQPPQGDGGISSTPAPQPTLVPKAEPSSSASSPASAGASANALPTTTVGPDGKIPFEDVFKTAVPVTPDALYAKVSGLFNARVHFENWWAKHADDLKAKTLEEAVLYARDDHWYRDADRVKQFFEFGKSQLNLTTNQIMSALNNVNDRDMLKVSEWSGGNVNMAQAALWAYHANYDQRAIQALNLDKQMQLMAAQWCEVAAAKERTSA